MSNIQKFRKNLLLFHLNFYLKSLLLLVINHSPFYSFKRIKIIFKGKLGEECL